MSEQRFEYRLIKILQSLGFLCLNIAKSTPFDIVAIKNNIPYVIEVKGKNTPYPRKQQLDQFELSLKANTPFYVIRQSKKIRGRIQLSMFLDFKGDQYAKEGYEFLRKILCFHF